VQNGHLLRITRRDGCTLEVVGEVDLSTVEELVETALGPPVARRLVLTDTTFIDAGGVGGLKRIADAARVLELVAPHPRVRRILDLLMPGGASWFRIVHEDRP
jgi:anti-anti-sigma regulatory factor